MVVFSYCDTAQARSRAQQLRQDLARTFNADSFQNAIRRATGDRARVFERVGEVVRAFEAAGVSVAPELSEALATGRPAQ